MQLMNQIALLFKFDKCSMVAYAIDESDMCMKYSIICSSHIVEIVSTIQYLRQTVSYCCHKR